MNESDERLYWNSRTGLKKALKVVVASYQDICREEDASTACRDFGNFENDDVIKFKATRRNFKLSIKQVDITSAETYLLTGIQFGAIKTDVIE